MNTGNKKVRKVKNLGTVYYDNVKSKYVGQIEVGTYANGRTKFKRFYGDSQNSVIDKTKEYNVKYGGYVLSDNSNEVKDTIITKDYFENFLCVIKKSKLKPASYTREVGTFKNHILPYIGDYKLSELTPNIIQTRLINALIEKGYSYSTVHKVYILMNECLRHAYRQDIIPKNPCELVEEPSKKIFTHTKEIRSLMMMKLKDLQMQPYLKTNIIK